MSHFRARANNGLRRRRFEQVAVIAFIAACVLGCSTTRIKWRLRWDSDKENGKEAYLERPVAKHPARPPNIVLLVADDLGLSEVSAYGAQHIHTPNIDRIAREGVLFDQGYATAPTCAPSRAGLMTGRVQNRFGFETQLMEFYPTNWVEYLSGRWFVDTGEFKLKARPSFPAEWQVAKQGVPPGEVLLSEALKKQGYSTAIIGKWHLGSHRKLIPNVRGFDYQYGFYGHSTLYAPERNWSGVINYEHPSFSSQYQWNTGRSGHAAIRRNDEVIIEKRYLTFAIQEEINQYIEDHRDEPFFIYGAFNAPHVPFQAPVDYHCKYGYVKDDNKRVYYAMISALDDAIGAIHRKLNELNLEENTLIWFISDNGGASYTKATENAPLKGGKLTHFEGGISVPFMMNWKGHIPGGSRYHYPVSTTDIFATSLALAGGTLPTDRTYDGVNLYPHVTGVHKGRPHETLYWRADHVWAMRDGDTKLILSTRDRWAELYDLERDRIEHFNLKKQMPELYERLRDKHETWQKQNLPKRPMWPRIMDRRFVLDGKEYLFPA